MFLGKKQSPLQKNYKMKEKNIKSSVPKISFNHQGGPQHLNDILVFNQQRWEDQNFINCRELCLSIELILF